MSLSDLINEGNLGLIRAAHKFVKWHQVHLRGVVDPPDVLQALAEHHIVVCREPGRRCTGSANARPPTPGAGREPTVEEIAEKNGHLAGKKSQDSLDL